MSVICFGGVCVPYSALLPLLLIVLRPLWQIICNVLGIENFLDAKNNKKKNNEADAVGEDEGACSGGVCAMKNSPPASSTATATDGSVAKSVPVPDAPFYLTPDLEWKSLLARSHKHTLLIRFTAAWCVPCKKIEPLFTSLGSELMANGAATFVSVDVDEFPDYMNEYSVTGLPYTVAIRGGEVKGSYRGSAEIELRKFVESAVAGR